MNDQATVTQWARAVAQSYAEACRPRLPALDEVHLAGALETPLADCILLAIPPSDWPAFYINPTLGRWEAMTRRRPGPRLQSVNYGSGTITMG